MRKDVKGEVRDNRIGEGRGEVTAYGNEMEHKALYCAEEWAEKLDGHCILAFTWIDVCVCVCVCVYNLPSRSPWPIYVQYESCCVCVCGSVAVHCMGICVCVWQCG